jgi:hypothetical protein
MYIIRVILGVTCGCIFRKRSSDKVLGQCGIIRNSLSLTRTPWNTAPSSSGVSCSTLTYRVITMSSSDCKRLHFLPSYILPVSLVTSRGSSPSMLDIYPSQSAITTATCLHVVAMSIATYEYVAHFISLSSWLTFGQLSFDPPFGISVVQVFS